jgi:hypothetical protein
VDGQRAVRGVGVVRHVERAVAGGHDRRVVDLPGEELADRGGDLLDMGLQGEVTGVDKTNVSVGDVAGNRAGAPAWVRQVLRPPGRTLSDHPRPPSGMRCQP